MKPKHWKIKICLRTEGKLQQFRCRTILLYNNFRLLNQETEILVHCSLNEDFSEQEKEDDTGYNITKEQENIVSYL